MMGSDPHVLQTDPNTGTYIIHLIIFFLSSSLISISFNMLTAIISIVSYLSLLIFLVVNCFQFPEENCTAKHAWAMIGIRAMCQPHPTIEVMMDHIVLKGKKLSTVKRLFPSHVTIHQCIGSFIAVDILHVTSDVEKIDPGSTFF